MVFRLNFVFGTIHFRFHIIYIVTGGNNPVPWGKDLRVRDLWCYGNTVGFRKIKFIEAAAVRTGRDLHDLLNDLDAILICQIVTVIAFLIG